MIHLRANIIKITGTTRHYQGKVGPEGPVKSHEFPKTYYVEIEQHDDGFYLLYFDEKGECFTDGWHLSLEEAKAQAKFEFFINDEDWVAI